MIYRCKFIVPSDGQSGVAFYLMRIPLLLASSNQAPNHTISFQFTIFEPRKPSKWHFIRFHLLFGFRSRRLLFMPFTSFINGVALAVGPTRPLTNDHWRGPGERNSATLFSFSSLFLAPSLRIALSTRNLSFIQVTFVNG